MAPGQISALEREPNETEEVHEAGTTRGRAVEASTREGEAGDHTCPLCGLGGQSERTIYTHLQTGHRKSDIARAVLDGADQ